MVMDSSCSFSAPGHLQMRVGFPGPCIHELWACTPLRAVLCGLTQARHPPLRRRVTTIARRARDCPPYLLTRVHYPMHRFQVRIFSDGNGPSWGPKPRIEGGVTAPVGRVQAARVLTVITVRPSL